MTQDFPYPAKLFADAAKSFQELSGQNLNSINSYMPPVAQAAARFSIEVMRFASKRVVEFSELPEKLAKCQSTPDMFRVQMGFFEVMRQQYAEEWFRLMEIANDASWRHFRLGVEAEAQPEWKAMTSSWSPTTWSPMTAWQNMTAWQKMQRQDRPEYANGSAARPSASSRTAA